MGNGDNRGGGWVVGEGKDELERNRPSHSRKLQKTNILVSSTMVLSAQTFSMEWKRDIEPWGLIRTRRKSIVESRSAASEGILRFTLSFTPRTMRARVPTFFYGLH